MGKGGVRVLVQRIPNPFETEAFEILRIHSGEFSDTLTQQREGGTPIVGAAAGKVVLTQMRF